MTLIEERTGLSVQTQRRAEVQALLQQISLGEPEAYLRRLHNSPDSSPEWQRLLHTLTIGETYFLRDKRYFEILRENVLPRLTLTRQQNQDLRLTIWCVGCSTGEEPYSVATVIHEFVPDVHDWHVTILGTDINQRAIDTARRGLFRQWSFRHTPPSFLKRYFTPEEDGYRIADHIHELVTFRQHNLLSGAPIPQIDIIFCRNVLMYFSRDHIFQAETTLYRALTPGGWLLLGQAEALHTRDNEWNMHLYPGTPVYQKPSETEPFLIEPISYPTRPDRMPTAADRQDEPAPYREAVQAVHEDRPLEAEHRLSELLADNPQHAKAHILLAAIFANRQAYPEAQAHIDEALEMNGLLADAHYVRALIQLEQGQLETARQYFTAAIYCQRHHPLACLMLGNLLAQQGDESGAQKSWRNAYRGLESHAPEDYVSALSDLDVASLRGLLENNLDGEI